MFEYYTIGGGWFLFNFFSAVSAIAQSSAYGYVMQSALLLSSGWVLFMLAFQAGRWNILTNWAAVSIIVVSTLMVPSATVKVTDRINTVDSAGYIISDVPYGLALFSSLTSQIGDGLTSLFEDNFADVNSPSLQQHGFLFGVKLLAASTQIEVQDANFESTLSSFIRNCTFYDILQGRKSFQTLQTSADPWAYISSDPARARMFEYATTSGSGTSKSITTCAAGIADLNQQWIAETESAATRLALSISSNRGNQNDQVVRALVQTELSSFHQYLIGASRTSADILKRQMTINALLREPANWMAERGNDAALTNYIDARLQLQTRESYKSIGRQAERWVANLKAVFQCIYIGIFPIAALLMLSPMGATILKNYVFGLVWIESWGALFALLNYIMNSTARQEMLAAVKAASTASGDITLLAQAGIQAVESDISVMAGYLSMSVPFISLALVAGAGRFAYLATSTLAVSQEAVASTTQEAVTGNLSAGNTQYDNHNFHNYSGFNRNTSASWESGESLARAPDGSEIKQVGDGGYVVKSGGAISDTGTGGVNVSKGIGERLGVVADKFESAGKGFSTASNEQVSLAQGQTRGISDSIFNNKTSDFKYNEEDSGRIGEDFSIAQNVGRDLAKSHNVSDDEALRATVAARAAFSKFGLSASAEGQYNISANSSISYSDALKATESQSASGAFNRITSASTSETAGWSDGYGTSYSDGQEVRFSESNSLDARADASYQKAESLRESAERFESSSVSSSQNLNQSFYEWTAQQPGSSGAPLGEIGAAKLLNSSNPEDQAYSRQLVNNYVQGEAANIISEVARPDIEGVYNAGAADITAGSSLGDDYVVAAGALNDGGTVVDNVNANTVNTGIAATRTINEADAFINAGRGNISEQSSNTENTVDQNQGYDKPQRLGKTAFNEVGQAIESVSRSVSLLDSTPAETDKSPVPSVLGQKNNGGF